MLPFIQVLYFFIFLVVIIELLTRITDCADMPKMQDGKCYHFISVPLRLGEENPVRYETFLKHHERSQQHIDTSQHSHATCCVGTLAYAKKMRDACRFFVLPGKGGGGST